MIVVVVLDGDGDLYVVDLLVDDFTTRSLSPSPSSSTTTTTTTSTAFRDGHQIGARSSLLGARTLADVLDEPS